MATDSTRPRNWFAEAACLVVVVFLPPQALACPDCQYEACAFTACVCLPKDQCVVPQVIKDIVKEAEKGPRLVATTVDKAVKDVAATVKKAFDDGVRTVAKAADDVAKNVDKAGKDTAAEAGRFGREVETAGRALVHHVENTTKGHITASQRAIQQVREGKVIDAIWHAGLAPIQISEKSASEAVLESSYLRAVGQIVATTYGGPAGAAAYTAWLTFKQTGDASLALRVGLLSGASAYAFSSASQIDGSVKKAIVTGAIGGLGVAAAGGDENAVREAFLMAGGMVLIQDGFREYTTHDADPSPSKGEAYCISAASTDCTTLPKGAIVGTDDKGNFIVDMTNAEINPAVPAVGLKDHTAYFSEQNQFMTSVSRVPGMQAMAVFHDVWAIKWDMGALMTPATILPAMVLTYTGFGAPYYDKLRETAVDRALKPATAECCASEPLKLGEPQVQPFLVKDAYVRFDPQPQAEPEVLVHEVNSGSNLYCYDGTLIKSSSLSVNPKLLQLVTVDKCIRKADLDFPNRPPPAYHDACRVLKSEGGHWRVVQSSVFDRDECTATVREMAAAAATDTARWMRADARTPAAK